jgi:hypothetical protein
VRCIGVEVWIKDDQSISRYGNPWKSYDFYIIEIAPTISDGVLPCKASMEEKLA